jgi:RNA polymerase sigma-70 factor (ECF subfamily)
MPDAASSFEEFYEATYRRLYTALCLTTGNEHEAEEILQDAFLRVFERWERVSRMDSREGYLYTTAMNVFRNRYRRANLALRRSLQLASSTDELGAVEDRDEIVRLLRPLSPSERAAIVLTTLVDLPADEVGRMLGVKPSTVRVLASRARSHMKSEEGSR